MPRRRHDQSSLMQRATRPLAHVRHPARHLRASQTKRGSTTTTFIVLLPLAAAAAQSGTNNVDTLRSPHQQHHSQPPGQDRALRAERDVLVQATSPHLAMESAQLLHANILLAREGSTLSARVENTAKLVVSRKAPEATPQGTPEIYLNSWPAELTLPFP